MDRIGSSTSMSISISTPERRDPGEEEEEGDDEAGDEGGTVDITATMVFSSKMEAS